MFCSTVVYALRLCFLSCVAFDFYFTTRCLVLRLIDTLVRSVCVVFVISYVCVLCIALCSIFTLARALSCVLFDVYFRARCLVLCLIVVLVLAVLCCV